MTLNVNLAEHDGDHTTLTPLEDVVFIGGEVAMSGLVTFALDGHEIVGRVVAIEPETDIQPETVIVERSDSGILIDNPPVTFTMTGQPPQAAPDTDKLDLAAPENNVVAEGEVRVAKAD